MLNDCLYCVKQTHGRHTILIFYANFHIHIPKQQVQVDTTKWREVHKAVKINMFYDTVIIGLKQITQLL